MPRTFWVICVFSLNAALIAAQEVPTTTAPSPEEFKIEAEGSAWLLDTGGTVANRTTSLDLVNDLGVEQQMDTFYGRFVYKLRPKHEIVIEGAPFRLDGDHTATKTFVFHGQSFTAGIPLQTRASLDYVFAGYQYNLINGRAGHVGISAGGAFLNASGTLTEPALGITSNREQKGGLPLAGIEGRVFPVPSRVLDINGSVRGMDFGSYGHYVETQVSAGFWFARHIGIHAGFRDIDALLQNTGAITHTGKIDVQSHGPIFTASFKW